MVAQLDLNKQVAIVSGGGSGIGLAIATEFARAGANVVICSRNIEKLNKEAKNIEKISGRKCLPIQANVRKIEDIECAVDKIMKVFGRIDILVNNAGGGFKCAVEDITPNGWDSIIETNLKSTFLFCKAAGKIMIQQKGGKIINMSSFSGLYGIPQAAAYSAAKAGIINFTKVLSAEWAKYNIRINSIAPGPILVEGYEELMKKTGMKELPKSPFAMNRWGKPEEIAKIALFLASDWASFILGETIAATGGPLSEGIINI